MPTLGARRLLVLRLAGQAGVQPKRFLHYFLDVGKRQKTLLIGKEVLATFIRLPDVTAVRPCLHLLSLRSKRIAFLHA